MAGSQHIVAAGDRRIVRRALHDVRVGACFFSDAVHDVDETVERVAALVLCRFNHHGLVEEQREVDGWCVEAVVKEAFGHIERSDTRGLVAEAVEHELVHGPPMGSS